MIFWKKKFVSPKGVEEVGGFVDIEAEGMVEARKVAGEWLKIFDWYMCYLVADVGEWLRVE